MKVLLDYFKLTGKWYSSFTYHSTKTYPWDIEEEVRKQRDDGNLPGLAADAREFHVLVTCEDGIGVPRLLPYNPINTNWTLK